MAKKKKNASYLEVIAAAQCPVCYAAVGSLCVSKIDRMEMAGIHRPRRELMPGYRPGANRRRPQ